MRTRILPCAKIKRMKINGKDLIEMGYRQGKWFKTALIEANAQRLTGESLKSFLDEIAPKIIDPHSEPVPYHCNIRAESEEETANVASVKNTMFGLMKTPTVINGVYILDLIFSNCHRTNILSKRIDHIFELDHDLKNERKRSHSKRR